LRAARRLIRERRFDAAWHLTWANAWIGSTLPLTGLPFVYGPVGGGVGAPWRLVASLGGHAFISELGREVVRTGFRYLNPLCRLASRRAALVLAQNPETRDWLPGAPRGKTVVFSNAVTGDIPRRKPKLANPPYTALWAGRMLAWKGASLAIRTMALLPDWQLLVVGDGPEEANLHRQVRDMSMEGRVEFLGRITRPDVLQVMRERTDLLLFPSLHDDAGMIVAEAVAMGIPAVCLDRGGPPVLGGVGVKAGSADQTVRDLAEAVRAALIGVAAPDRLSAPLPATLEARRAELADLVRRFEVFEPEGNSPLKVLAASPGAARMRPDA
jgi:glycosyltransferase involved in cell wall biosynthesis